MNRPITIAILAAAMLALSACSSAESRAGPTTTKAEVDLELVPRNYEEFRAQPTICEAAAPDPVTPMQFDVPDELVDATDAITATISTSCGDMVVELDPLLAPESVNSFIFLAEAGYFDGTVFHRLIPGFVLQGGDQTATGRGGPGYSIPDEVPPAGVGYEPGTLAMANAGPGTTGSQFFVVLHSIGLPPQYSIFGFVVEGLETLDRLQTVPLGQTAGSADLSPSTPLETIYIDTVTVER
jgi:cyclophilin family peptidyl-prolyl cis-trans isomerase